MTPKSALDLENPNPGPGDALRDEAGNLLSARWGVPLRETLIEGKTADLLFRKSEFGKVSTLIVEAKDRTSVLTRDQLSKIWADYSGAVSKNAPCDLLVVTRNGLAPGAQALVDSQPALLHQTIWQLENDVVGLTAYIRSLTKLFDQGDLRGYYVPGRVRRALYSGQTRGLALQDKPLFQTVQDWIASEDPRPMAILGGYGAGKSSFAKQLIADQAAKALADPLARRPILIGLGGLSRYSSLPGLLGGMFTHEFPIDGFNTQTFLELSDRGRLLMVLDGFDEMKHAMSWSDFRAQIANLNRLTEGKAKVLLLGRPSAFISADEHFHVLRGMRRMGESFFRLPDWPEFIEYDLEAFSAEERKRFVQGYLTVLEGRSRAPRGEAWISGRADEVNRLADHDPEIFAKPVHAKILTDLAADPEVDLAQFADGVSRWKLYEVFFRSLAEREGEKDARRPISEHQRLEFLRELAFWLWSTKGGATAFSAHDIPDALLGVLPPGDVVDLDALKREYLIGAFLEKKADDVFYFGHRSFAEFLVAQRMLQKPPGPAEHGLYSNLLRDGVAVFLDEAPNHSPVVRWTETLAAAQGTLHLPYLRFIAHACGGVAAMIERLPSQSILSPVLAALGDEVVLDGVARINLISALRHPRNEVFFLIVRLLQIHAAQNDPPNRHDLAVEIAAALLDRTFATAQLDEETGKAPINATHEEARSLAYATLPKLQTVTADRLLRFQGTRLGHQDAESYRLCGVEITEPAPVALRQIFVDLDLPWSTVLRRLQDHKDVIINYFRRNDSLGAVFVRDRAPLRRR